MYTRKLGKTGIEVSEIGRIGHRNPGSLKVLPK